MQDNVLVTGRGYSINSGMCGAAPSGCTHEDSPQARPRGPWARPCPKPLSWPPCGRWSLAGLRQSPVAGRAFHRHWQKSLQCRVTEWREVPAGQCHRLATSRWSLLLRWRVQSCSWCTLAESLAHALQSRGPLTAQPRKKDRSRLGLPAGRKPSHTSSREILGKKTRRKSRAWPSEVWGKRR